MKNLHSLQSFTLHRIVFHGNQSLLKLRDFEMNYFLLFLAFYCTNLSLVVTSLVILPVLMSAGISLSLSTLLWTISSFPSTSLQPCGRALAAQFQSSMYVVHWHVQCELDGVRVGLGQQVVESHRPDLGGQDIQTATQLVSNRRSSFLSVELSVVRIEMIFHFNILSSALARGRTSA